MLDYNTVACSTSFMISQAYEGASIENHFIKKKLKKTICVVIKELRQLTYFMDTLNANVKAITTFFRIVVLHKLSSRSQSISLQLYKNVKHHTTKQW